MAIGAAHDDQALLKFFLGPVQPFIAGARTVRDLWTGSYLLSWLTFAAMRPILKTEGLGVGAFVSPSLEGNPLLWTLAPRGNRPAGITTPCLPNNFTALIPPGHDAQDLAGECVRECDKEWLAICQEVRKAIGQDLQAHASDFRASLDGRTVDLAADWARLWVTDAPEQSQITSFFEVRAVVLPAGQPDAALRKRLLEPERTHDWLARMDVLAGLMDARKAVRHVPPYRPTGNVPQKCSLLGTYEQMGPAELAESRAFWDRFAEHVRIEGERTRANERLCAISLVKRFAWPAFLAGKLRHGVKDLSYSDTATLAAAAWLPPPAEMPEEGLDWRRLRRWSGQWLHWIRPDQDESEKCPRKVWDFLQERKHARGKPPAYYAILMVDADRLGEKLQEAPGPGRSRTISAALTHFALHVVPKVVEDHAGELIYAGGDDLLALLPTAEAIACARRAQEEYERNWAERVGGQATVSGGLAVVHYKEDLRFALQQARDAEHAAKRAGRNALALTVCRRSGEHTTAVLGWQQAGAFQEIVGHFVRDRWAYKLRAELTTLQGLPWAAVEAEVGRLLSRLEGIDEKTGAAFQQAVKRFLVAYHKDMTDQDRSGDKLRRRSEADALADFVILCQAASFFARGRETR
jgi:CRISPR-associated protein Cmr2